MTLEYRPCVVAVFTNSAGQILVGERTDSPGSWQLPQGGIDPGESAIAALYREMREELGCDSFRVVGQSSREIRYSFPADLQQPIAKKYRGQSQLWFHVEFQQGAAPDLKKSEGEFRAISWKSATEILAGIIAWKKDAYRDGLTALDLLN